MPNYENMSPSQYPPDEGEYRSLLPHGSCDAILNTVSGRVPLPPLPRPHHEYQEHRLPSRNQKSLHALREVAGYLVRGVNERRPLPTIILCTSLFLGSLGVQNALRNSVPVAAKTMVDIIDGFTPHDPSDYSSPSH